MSRLLTTHRFGRLAACAAAVSLGAIAAAHPATTSCEGFRPTRHDMRGAPPVLARPIAALPGDFDHNSVPDVAVVNKFIDGFLQDGSISVLSADADGNLKVASTQVIEGFSQWATSGDFNEDDLLDVAAVTIDSALIFFGNGLGGFQPQVRIPLTLDPIYVVAADMNSDMHLDLVVVQQWISSATGRVTVLLGDGAGGFTPQTPAPVGQDPRSGVVGDFNEDGLPDVVTGNNLSSNVTFLPGLGNGNFGPPRHTPVGASGGFLGAADFNSDTHLDLVMTSETIVRPAVILSGLGDGGFAVGATLQVGDTPRNPLVCDFDRDGRLDIAVPNAGSGDISLLFGGAGGTFSPAVNVGTDGGPSQASVNDLNGDAFCDVVTANEGNNSVSVLLGGPRGTIGTPTINVGSAPLDLATADFNGDGHLDLAVANRDDNTVSMYRGDGEGGLYLTQVQAVGDNPVALDIADFNGDSKPDLVVAEAGPVGSSQTDTITVLQNDTTGGFYVQTTETVGDVPLDVKAADYNGDGVTDIAVANSQTDKVSFYYGTGGGGFGSLKNVRVAEPQRWLAPADLNGDGRLDLAIAVMNQNAILPLLGTAQGFETGVLVNLGGPYLISRVEAADLDSDGAVDLLAVSRASDTSAVGQLAVLMGNGDATFFEPYPRLSTGLDPEGLVILDLDRTAGIDVVVSNRFNNDVMTFLGNGTGSLTPAPSRYGAGNGPFSLITGDFNEDFRADVAAVNFGGGTVSLLLNDYPIDDKIQSLVIASDHTMTWNAVPGAASYRVYRGALSTLDADFYGQCLAPTVTEPSYVDTAIPPPGDGFFFLVSVFAGGNEGPLGYSSNCLSRPNFYPCFVP